MHDDLRAELAHAATGPVTIDITTIGRTSGVPRRIEIWLVNVNGRVIICGTPDPRDWMANVRADPSVTLHFKERARFDVEATATVVTDLVERREVWEHSATRWYRGEAPLDDLIDTAPIIELHIGVAS